MSYLNFNKTELVDLQYSLTKELLRTNRSGAYLATTIPGCNTRKYHGLLVAPLPELDGASHVLLSSLDATVVQHNKEFNLGIHKYEGNHYDPKGHKYLKKFSVDTIPVLTYRVGGVILQVEKLLVEKEQRVLIKYTLVEATSETSLKLKPFLAFRSIHAVSKANMDANTRLVRTQNGIVSNLYDGYPNLYMQLSEKNEFVASPDWFYDIEYREEQRRGYEYKEDLFTPGYFEVNIKKGESIVFSASTSECDTASFLQEFDKGVAGRIPRDSFEHCLLNSAQQFVRRQEDYTELIAGYPWYNSIARDTLISMPTLALENKDEKTYHDILKTLFNKLELDEDCFFLGEAKSADTPLWLFRSLQQYREYRPKIDLWSLYKAELTGILNNYRNNTLNFIQFCDNGLLYIYDQTIPFTWMNSMLGNTAVVNRYGFAVEVCALWYNAIMFSLELAKESSDFDFVDLWTPIARKAEQSFRELFLLEEEKYLADFVADGVKNKEVRPNQVIAISMPHSPLDKKEKIDVLKIAEQELLTDKGLRTLSPQSLHYEKKYRGTHQERELAHHQGSVCPWLLLPFSEAYLACLGESGKPLIEKLYRGFEDEITEYGIGTIGEIYNGDPPHKPKGAISMATSVAAILRMKKLLKL